MTILSKEYFDADWNNIIEEFHKIQTKIIEENLICANIIKVNENFNNCIYRNTPNEAEILLWELKELIKQFET